MIIFERYAHINDLMQHYIDEMGDKTISEIIKNGVTNEEEAIAFSRFIWRLPGQMNEDEEAGKMVLGGTDNSEMLPDLVYEVTKYMRDVGYYSIWEKVSKKEMESDE